MKKGNDLTSKIVKKRVFYCKFLILKENCGGSVWESNPLSKSKFLFKFRKLRYLLLKLGTFWGQNQDSTIPSGRAHNLSPSRTASVPL